MAEVLGAITELARAIDGDAANISSGAVELAQRAEQQASSIEETSATMEELSGIVRKNADNAATAATETRSATTLAEEGGEVVRDAVAAMARISDSSQKISDIIGVIDLIAFQTNLLALNAAVEAARAGDAGKGFAVVASEVRTLAQRSSEAAKDIKQLIEASSNEVTDGVRLVNATGESLSQIVSTVFRLSELVDEISSASNEQANGVDEINGAVTHMDDMTQKNASMADESAAAARSLTEEARQLTSRIGMFRLPKGVARERSPAPARRVEKPTVPVLAPQPVVTAETVQVSKPAALPPPSPPPVTNGASKGAANGKALIEESTDSEWAEF